MNSTDDDIDPIVLAEDDNAVAGGAEALFGSFSVLSPGVQIVLDGRPVSAPVSD